MNKRAIIVAFHQYTNFGSEFYAPILDHFMATMAKYQDEFDMLYLLDSTWDIGSVKDEWGISKVKVIKVDPSLRYYDAYKQVLPQIEEDLVLFMDNDMVVYRKDVIKQTFDKLEHGVEALGQYDSSLYDFRYDVVTIIDQIGTYETDKLKNGNKFCPYWFATRKDLLMKYLDIDWASHMPHSETLGLLTEAMLNNDVKVFEWEEDKSNILFDGTQDGEKSKDLGYYHIRSGSLPAYLLATKKYGDIKTYEDYLKNQPRSEILRQAAWYKYMGGEPGHIFLDLGITFQEFEYYLNKFMEYYGL